MVISIETLSEMVALWAASEPVVKTAYLFGSRVRGDNRCGSDLDVAIELTPRRCDSGPLATWIAVRRNKSANTLEIKVTTSRAKSSVHTACRLF